MQYIYSLKDPMTGTPFYVGYTNGLERRFKEHVATSIKNIGPNFRRNAKLKTLVEAGYGYGDIMVVEHQVDTVEEAKTAEISTIKYFGRVDLKEGPLLNMTDGGDGNALPGVMNPMFGKDSPFKGKRHSAEVREKLSESAKRNWVGRTHAEYFGVEKSKAIIDNLKSTRIGTHHSESTKEKIGRANSKKVFTEDEKKRLSVRLYESPPNAKSYKLVSPDGTEYFTVKGLIALCRDLGLEKKHGKALQELIRRGVHTPSKKNSIVYGWSIFYI